MGFLERRIRVAAMLLVAGLVCAPGCGERKNPAGATARNDDVPEVTVEKPVAREITDYFEFPGHTAAVGEVSVRARVTGYLDRVAFEDGQMVKKGDLLYEIDPRPYEAALDRARGELARLEALLEKAKLNVERSKRLLPSGAVSQDELEQHEANLRVGEAAIQTAKADLRNAELNLEFTQVRSPIDGRVSRTRITEGNLVQSVMGESTILTTVVTVDPIYVYFDMDERAMLQYVEQAARAKQDFHLSWLKQQKVPVRIALENEKGFPHEGVFDFADNKLDRTTGTLRVRAKFANPDGYLAPGQYVRVQIPFGRPHTALLVPEKAVGRDLREKFVLTVNEKDVVEYRKIEAGSLHDGMRVVRSGVGPDDWVVVEGLPFARPNAAVKPIRRGAGGKKSNEG